MLEVPLLETCSGRVANSSYLVAGCVRDIIMPSQAEEFPSAHTRWQDVFEIL